MEPVPELEGDVEGLALVERVAVGLVVEVGLALPESLPLALGVVLGVAEGEGVPVPEALPESLPVAVELGVEEAEGVSVPVGVALAGALLGAALALAPGRASVASQAPPHLTYCAGQAVLPLCWQHVSMGSATLRGLKCMR